MDLTYPETELRSETVRIRKWTYGDLRCIEAAGTDPEIPQGTTIPAVYTEAEGRAFIGMSATLMDEVVVESGALAIARADTNEAVGHIYLGLTESSGSADSVTGSSLRLGDGGTGQTLSTSSVAGC